MKSRSSTKREFSIVSVLRTTELGFFYVLRNCTGTGHTSGSFGPPHSCPASEVTSGCLSACQVFTETAFSIAWHKQQVTLKQNKPHPRYVGTELAAFRSVALSSVGWTALVSTRAAERHSGQVLCRAGGHAAPPALQEQFKRRVHTRSEASRWENSFSKCPLSCTPP